MKHFVIEVTYLAPIEKIDAALADHRAFLQKGYDAGLLLASGPQEPRTGGLIIARAESKAKLEAFFKDDPYMTLGLATQRYVEFSPVKRQALLDGWV